MKTITTKAIILRRVDFGEADRILTLLTPDQGKISAIAKGSRRAKSKLAGGLELFSISNIHLIDGKGELKTVVSAQLSRHFGNIVSELNRTMFAYECLKQIDQHTEHVCEEGYFSLLEASLESLNDTSIDLRVVKAWFMSRLLVLRGAHMNLERQSNGKAFEEEANYIFDFDEMAFISHSSGNFAPKHIKFMRLLMKVSSPKNLLHVGDAGEVAVDVEPLLRQALDFARR